ncbi:MAG TPA: hypothetical protein VF005_05055, partial [Acidimicrobiales bacterium]
VLRRIDESLTGGRSFGPAFERDGCLVIPVALVFGGGGGGSEGSEPGASAAGEQQTKGGPFRRTNDGGGFGLVSWPIGVYVVKDGEARWRPLVAFADVGFLVLMLARVFSASRNRSRRHRRRHGQA